MDCHGRLGGTAGAARTVRVWRPVVPSSAIQANGGWVASCHWAKISPWGVKYIPDTVPRGSSRGVRVPLPKVVEVTVWNGRDHLRQ